MGKREDKNLVHAIITISFICLLRVEETLNLLNEDIEILESGHCISITLRKRKTNQFGGEKTNLHSNLDMTDTRYQTICFVDAPRR